MTTEHVFVWKHSDDWRDCAIRWFEQTFSKQFQDKAKLDPENLYELSPDQSKMLAAQFAVDYDRIRLFHACRPNDVGSYLHNGIRPLDPQDANKTIRRLFSSDKFPNITELALSKAFEEAKEARRIEDSTGNIYFCVDSRELKKGSRHYWTYGSEYVQVVAKSITRITGVDCLSSLKAEGIPTILVCDVPLDYLPENRIQRLSFEMVRRALCMRRDKGLEVGDVIFSFKSSRKLPASFITSHYHPNDVLTLEASGSSQRPVCPFCSRQSAD